MVIDSYLLATSPKRKVLLADISYKFWRKVVITLGILSKMLLLDIYEWLFVYLGTLVLNLNGFFEKGAHPFHKERICQLIFNFGSSQFLVPSLSREWASKPCHSSLTWITSFINWYLPRLKRTSKAVNMTHAPSLFKKNQLFCFSCSFFCKNDLFSNEKSHSSLRARLRLMPI